MIDLIRQVVLELARALLLEELVSRVRRKIRRLVERREQHRRARRFIHTLRTRARRDQ
jgi:hypothetical protein